MASQVTKHVTGETAGYVANSTFTVSYTCTDGTDGTLTLKDGPDGRGHGPAHRHLVLAVGDGQAGDQGRQLRLG